MGNHISHELVFYLNIALIFAWLPALGISRTAALFIGSQKYIYISPLGVKSSVELAYGISISNF
jgi:hypothetical protein